MIKKIKNIDDVKLFAKQIIQEGTSLHPDNDFADYINVEDSKQTYTEEEAIFRNSLLMQCFTVCKKENIDIYDIMNEITLLETGLNRFIPMPSEIVDI